MVLGQFIKYYYTVHEVDIMKQTNKTFIHRKIKWLKDLSPFSQIVSEDKPLENNTDSIFKIT